MRYTAKTQMVCATQIAFDLDGNVVRNVVFTNGCNGNLKAIGKLVEGMTVEQIEGYLSGNTCGNKPTSCADQLARAVRAKYNESQASK
ncbi:MAG: TIGR03905 family TSCPD domain-containing protein [Clostridiales bacterium]|nr:TIGR03905 family TSCPD domain-containing protein [Clostridiales bacterium]